MITGVQAAYWVMLDEGRITQTTANLLMLSVDEAIDRVSYEALCDWKGLKSYVSMPNYSKFLRSSIIPQKLVTLFAVERLESACYICAAFLRAHRIARQQLHDFIGKNYMWNITTKNYCIQRKLSLSDLDFKYFLYYVISKSCFPLLDQNSEKKIEEFLNFAFPQLHETTFGFDLRVSSFHFICLFGRKVSTLQNTTMVELL